MLREPAHLLRAKCTDIFKDTLKIRSGKVSHLSAQGLQVTLNPRYQKRFIKLSEG